MSGGGGVSPTHRAVEALGIGAHGKPVSVQGTNRLPFPGHGLPVRRGELRGRLDLDRLQRLAAGEHRQARSPISRHAERTEAEGFGVAVQADQIRPREAIERGEGAADEDLSVGLQHDGMGGEQLADLAQFRGPPPPTLNDFVFPHRHWIYRKEGSESRQKCKNLWAARSLELVPTPTSSRALRPLSQNENCCSLGHLACNLPKASAILPDSMRRLAVFFIALAGSLLGQQPPHDVFPPAEPPYHRVRYETSIYPDGRVFPVNYTVWIPPGVKSLRGVIVHQHGCGEGSCKSGLTGAFDLHWQALARKHRCALMAPSYEQPASADCQLWCDPRKGSDATFQRSLSELGALSGHPELAKVPWALWGHSGGGHWAGGMVLLHPERIVGAWLRSGVPPVKSVDGRPTPYRISKAACQVPVMCNFGIKEGATDQTNRFAGVWPDVEVFFQSMRGQGALIGVAIDPLTSHECGNQRYLAIPWLDACLTARLPTKTGAPLKPMPSSVAWLAPLNVTGRELIAPRPGS